MASDEAERCRVDGGAGGRPHARIRIAAVGVRLSRSLRRVLARARQCILGRHFRGLDVPAAPWRVAAQGMVPHDRNGGGRGVDCRALCLVPAGSGRFSPRSGAMGRSVCVRCNAAAQLRCLRGGAGGLHRGNTRKRYPRCDRRHRWPHLQFCGHARERDLDRHRVRRHRARRHRFRRRAAAIGEAVCRPGRQYCRSFPHYADPRRAIFGYATDPTRIRPAGYCAGPGDRRSDRRIVLASLSRSTVAASR